MITDNEKFIETQGILSHSDISSNECIKINNLIIELSKENQELKDNWNTLKEYLYNQIPTDKTVLTKHIKIFEVLDKMQEIEGSDSNGQ